MSTPDIVCSICGEGILTCVHKQRQKKDPHVIIRKDSAHTYEIRSSKPRVIGGVFKHDLSKFIRDILEDLDFNE